MPAASALLVLCGCALAPGLASCAKKGPPPAIELTAEGEQGAVVRVELPAISLDTSMSVQQGTPGHLHVTGAPGGMRVLQEDVMVGQGGLTGRIILLPGARVRSGRHTLEFTCCIAGHTTTGASAVVLSRPFRIHITIREAECEQIWSRITGTWLYAEVRGSGENVGFSTAELRWEQGSRTEVWGDTGGTTIPYEVYRENGELFGFTDHDPGASLRPPPSPRPHSDCRYPTVPETPVTVPTSLESLRFRGRSCLYFQDMARIRSAVRVRPLEEIFPEDLLEIVEDRKDPAHLSAVFAIERYGVRAASAGPALRRLREELRHWDPEEKLLQGRIDSILRAIEPR